MNWARECILFRNAALIAGNSLSRKLDSFNFNMKMGMKATTAAFMYDSSFWATPKQNVMLLNVERLLRNLIHDPCSNAQQNIASKFIANWWGGIFDFDCDLQTAIIW